VDIVRRRIADLSLDPANARLHDERSITTLTASLRRFGQQGPIKLDRHGVVRAGNGLLIAAQRLGWTELDTVTSDLSGPDLAAYAIMDNRSAELSTWDLQQLSAQLQSLQDEGWVLEEVGWTADEAAPLLHAEWGATTTDPDSSVGVGLGKPLQLTLEQRQVVDRAIAAVRAQEGTDLSEGRCVELICADYLSGAPQPDELAEAYRGG